jgi:hypothetical protein
MGLLLARPVLLVVSAIIGAGLGFVVSGNGGYQAQAVLQFNADSTDSVLVKQTGQTLARTAVAMDVVDAAEVSLGTGETDLNGRVTAEWTSDTKLVVVTVKADSEAAAIADANAVAGAVVDTTEAGIRAQLAAAGVESNKILNSQQLDSTEAEAARRSQIGNALASRQDAIASQAGDLSVIDPASTASSAGLTKPLGAAIGLTVGLLLAGLASLLLGVRGLYARSPRTLHQLVPDVDLRSPAQAAQIAGQFTESGKDALTVVATEGAADQALLLAKDVADFLRAHNKTVALVGPVDPDDRTATFGILRHHVRDDVRREVGSDVLVVVVSADSDASALLEGQSNHQALIVIRRKRTRMSAVLRALKAYGRATPVLVLAR